MSDLRQALEALASRPAPAGRGSTSDLSIDQVLLLHSIGWEPVDLVFGVSWWSIPWGSWSQWQVGEVETASAAFSGAVGEAIRQMRAECQGAGGRGVVGVELELRVAGTHVDVAVRGTAVRPERHHRDRGEQGARPAAEGLTDGPPFLSDLSARDFVVLTRAGWWPLGLAAGASFVIAPRRSARQWAAQQGQNVELPNLTEALYEAREGAMERMQRSGLELEADGVVGVKLREGPLGHSPRIIQFVAVGTAVRLLEESHRAISPEMVLPLDELVRQFEAASLRGGG